MTTPILGIEEIASNQNNKFVTHNDALRHLEVFASQVMVDRSLTAPPVITPSNGDIFYVNTASTGAWAGQDGNIALYTGSSYQFFSLPDFSFFFDKTARELVVIEAGVWKVLFSLP